MLQGGESSQEGNLSQEKGNLGKVGLLPHLVLGEFCPSLHPRPCKPFSHREHLSQRLTKVFGIARVKSAHFSKAAPRIRDGLARGAFKTNDRKSRSNVGKKADPNF